MKKLPARRHRRFNPKRKINPTPTQWAIIGAGLTAVVASLAIASSASAAPRGPDLPGVDPDLKCDPAPYEVDVNELQVAINAEIDAGNTDKALVATNVGMDLYGMHPSGASVSFPPGAQALAGVLCVWSIVLDFVDDEFKRRGLDPSGPGPGPGPDPGSDSLQWVLRSAGDPGYPWQEPVMQIVNYPTPGMFVDIGNSDSWNPESGYDSMIRAALGSALAMAGADVGIATSPVGQELRKQMRDAIMAVGGWNDLVYGQTNLNYAGGNDPDKPGGDANKGKSGGYVLNSAGRGLNWYPRHHDNITRIQNGDPPKRGTRINGTKIVGPNGGNKQMLIWIPAVDLQALAAPVPSIQFLEWSDGSSTADPPPQIRELGVDMSGVDLPGVDEPGIGGGGGGNLAP